MWHKIEHYIVQQQLLQYGERVLLALSGGPDSVALAHCLLQLADKYRWQLGAVHVNHRMRPGEAERDEEFVRRLCQEWNIPLYVEKLEQPPGSEEAARAARYRVFEQLLNQGGWDKIALGHHQDDQAETLFWHLLRGSGLDGLAGMAARRGKFIRPLLAVNRAEILAYLKKNDLQWCVDSSNLLPIYTRNRIRQVIFPFLEREIQPALRKHLARTAELLRDELELLEKVTDQYWQETVLYQNEMEIVLDLKSLQTLPAALQRRLIRRAWREFTAAEHPLSWAKTEGVRRLLEKDGSASWRLKADLEAVKDYTKLVLRRRSVPVKEETVSEEWYLSLPGQIQLPDGTVIQAQVVQQPGELGPAGRELIYLWVPPEGELLVRYRRPGDRFRPAGAPGSKKLKEWMIDKKIPRSERERIPLVLLGEDIVWVVGWQAGHNPCRKSPGGRWVALLQRPGSCGTICKYE
ncbi:MULTISPECIES: tRNA lysidine(34) synthetase TilS [unclassified Carboxydocella]|uniref:tRNA lysidine(34) synthetase TilS n=1 Tax=unclassified Carboxydocella TaxID=2685367 RepID=UPI0009C7341A|nr:MULTISPECIES: tRNA lysidine(34) synthetase TilS [unclassified Carboxydocella]AVX29715.1 tRNA(Ile)-lysidine synthase [Carboxydocella thermautotrophica]GAW27471.1 tRNA lysidine(34) synthetase TilS [Carboxydocella sp. ULO1]GAW30370.1 tRNA lysidine(34) synthetase TilS [Carboxydocella sp. JDF658]